MASRRLISSTRAAATSPAAKLRAVLDKPGCVVMPCCFDALSAVMIQRADFPVTFMSGFGVSSTYGLPDTQLVQYAEMQQAAANITNAVSIPVIADGDTGYGNAMNVKRTVRGYAQAGVACIMLEDQKAPKRCGHTKGKDVVGMEEAMTRIQAAVDVREEFGLDILIMARTDARAIHGLDHAIDRCKRFVEIGADLTFLEAPRSEEEMLRYCTEVPGHKMANMLENGITPILCPGELGDMGYKLSAYPFALLNASIVAMNEALQLLKAGESPSNLSFKELQDIVGFTRYFEEEIKYKVDGEDN
mmetsp:Transcript_1429/g.2687  ORF Transcript_1429/g.2687 Transcript_1429/m.2687 type:complete len:303 (-) Transcript_1429:226-1134(-)